jgi:hypothetical protein
VTGFLTRSWDPEALTATIDRARDAADAELEPVSARGRAFTAARRRARPGGRGASAARSAGPVATGSGDPVRLGPLTAGWLVREHLPQVTLLQHATAAVTHGGNNSVTEAVDSGVPLRPRARLRRRAGVRSA